MSDVNMALLLFLLVPVVLNRANALQTLNKPSCEYQTQESNPVCFGIQLKQKYFYLANDFINFNHGSFGTVPVPVYDQQHAFFLESESFPDKWFRKSFMKYVERSRQLIASYVHSDENDIVLVENASSAVNSLLRSMKFKVSASISSS